MLSLGRRGFPLHASSSCPTRSCLLCGSLLGTAHPRCPNLTVRPPSLHLGAVCPHGLAALGFTSLSSWSGLLRGRGPFPTSTPEGAEGLPPMQGTGPGLPAPRSLPVSDRRPAPALLACCCLIQESARACPSAVTGRGVFPCSG